LKRKPFLVKESSRDNWRPTLIEIDSSEGSRRIEFASSAVAKVGTRDLLVVVNSIFLVSAIFSEAQSFYEVNLDINIL
jgi:hypothetical protein